MKVTRVMIGVSAGCGLLGTVVFAFTFADLSVAAMTSLAVSTVASYVNAVALEVDRRHEDPTEANPT